MPLRFLVVDGNTREGRETHRATYGQSYCESYAAVIRDIEPAAVCDFAMPADEGANLPDSAGLESYDAVVLTGSALHAYHAVPAVLRQVELARAVYRSGTPFFGSCWGIQIAAVAAGGEVRANPRGREVGFARNVSPTDAGRGHPLLAGRAGAWDAPAIHLDEVAVPPGDVTVLATNAVSPIQAAEIRHDGGLFWGVQYHPEFSLREMAAILGRYGTTLQQEGFFRDAAQQAATVEDLRTLHEDRGRSDLAWRYAIGRDLLDDSIRTTEIRNFIAHRVKPGASRRGRA
ncbi:type 1 glutamine amidotransferase [Alsobacter sp. R-9]